MAEAVSQLESVDALLVDAMRLEVDLPQTALIKGTRESVSIAAASVVAKSHTRSDDGGVCGHVSGIRF